MMLAYLLRRALLALALGGTALSTAGAPVSTEAGVVVEEVIRGGAAEEAGLEPGDMLLSWSRGPSGKRPTARGALSSPFILSEIEIEEAPLGEITLQGRRAARSMNWRVRFEDWGLRTSPVLPNDLRRLVDGGEELARANRFREAADRFRMAAEETMTRAQPLLSAWLLSKVAVFSNREKAPDKADAAFRDALGRAGAFTPETLLLRDWARMASERGDLELAESCLQKALSRTRAVTGRDLLTAAVLSDLGEIAEKKHDTASSRNSYQEALTIRESLAPDSAAVAAAFHSLGNNARQRAEFGESEKLLRRSLDLYERVAPGRLQSAAVLSSLAGLLLSEGRLAESAECHRRALAIREKLVPDSLAVAESLHGLGEVAMESGDFEATEGLLERALKIRERLSPGSPLVALSLVGLGKLMFLRNNLRKAESYWRDALALVENIPSESALTATVLNDLGTLDARRSAYETAQVHLRRSLEIRQKIHPGSLELGHTLENLGAIAAEAGDFGRAEGYYQPALAIYQKLSPGSLEVARTLFNLGDDALTCGDAERSRDLLLQAHSLTRLLAPSGLDLMLDLMVLGGAFEELGDLELAESCESEALAVAQRLVPGTEDEAAILHVLGVVAQKRKEQDAARDLLCLSMDALESQRAAWGATEETKQVFRARHDEYYRSCLESRVASGESSLAFEVLERSRSRALLEMMSERDLTLDQELPADLRRQRNEAHAAYDKATESLLEMKPSSDAAELTRLREEMSALRRKAQEIGGQIRQASPRFASLRYPEALTLARAREVLDPGTLLLSYAVGEKHTYLFLVEPAGAGARARDGLTIVEIPAGRDSLRTRITAFRKMLQDRTTNAWPVEARGLYDLLIRPAESLIAVHARLLISPDGPLSLCPFSALLRSTRGKAGRSQFLVEWKPLHVVASATLYGELLRLRDRAPSGSRTLVAFGDPRYRALGPTPEADPELRTAVTRGAVFSPLPFSRREVEDIARLFAGRSRLYLREEATEENAKALDKSAAYVHFSCHGFLDERVPLNSALVLTMPEAPGEGRENGLLQAWEILESVRLEADLVTLSACETGLGKEVAGEGLIGLTRAFQYAGARSVLASLWRVSDESTALLMKIFYASLASGKPKDEALRLAQIALIRRGSKDPWGPRSPLSSAHPLHWAAFQLTGDWK